MVLGVVFIFDFCDPLLLICSAFAVKYELRDELDSVRRHGDFSRCPWKMKSSSVSSSSMLRKSSNISPSSPDEDNSSTLCSRRSDLENTLPPLFEAIVFGPESLELHGRTKSLFLQAESGGDKCCRAGSSPVPFFFGIIVF
jgi:hypothetical protein